MMGVVGMASVEGVVGVVGMTGVMGVMGVMGLMGVMCVDGLVDAEGVSKIGRGMDEVGVMVTGVRVLRQTSVQPDPAP